MSDFCLACGGDVVLSASFSVRIALRREGLPLSGTVYGLSRRGIFFRSLTPPSVGSVVQVYLFTSRTAGLALRGQVEWQEPGGGCGILFGALPAFAEALVYQLGAQQPPSRISAPAREALSA